LVRIGHEELHNRLCRAVVTAGPDPAAQLVAMVREHVLAHADYPLLGVVANNELHALSPSQAATSLALREQSRQLLFDVLRHGRDTGVFTVADEILAGIAIGSMGLRVAHWFGPDQPYRREQVADAFADIALRIVGAVAVQPKE
jgi:hypothetical protein